MYRAYSDRMVETAVEPRPSRPARPTTRPRRRLSAELFLRLNVTRTGPERRRRSDDLRGLVRHIVTNTETRFQGDQEIVAVLRRALVRAE